MTNSRNDVIDGLKQYKSAIKPRFFVTKVTAALALYLVIKLLIEFVDSGIY